MKNTKKTDGPQKLGNTTKDAGAPEIQPIPEPGAGSRFEVEVDAKVLGAALSKLKPVAGSKTLPVLSCVRMTARKGELKLEATDLDVYAQARVEVVEGAVGGEGVVLVCLKRLASLVSLAAGGAVRMHSAGGKLVLRSGDWGASLLVLDPAEFPEPGCEEYTVIPVGVEEGALRRLLQLALVAVSTDESKYVLNGVRLLGEGAGLRAEATDGRRLVRATVEADAEGMDLLVPHPAARVVLGFLGAGREAVQVGAGARFVEVQAPGWTVRSKLIEGRFPNTDQVMPAEFSAHAKLDRAAFVGMVERADVLASDGSVGVVIEKSGAVSLDSATADVGDWIENGSVCVECPAKRVQFRANADYLMALAGPQCDEVRLQVQSVAGKGPLLWTCREKREEAADVLWQYVLMPLVQRDGKEGE